MHLTLKRRFVRRDFVHGEGFKRRWEHRHGLEPPLGRQLRRVLPTRA